jgi:DNA-binding IclR family transcriptional regulator
MARKQFDLQPELQGPSLTSVANVKSAARVLSIFEYFERERRPKTLSEISQDLDYPVSSTLALLRSIQTMGYLDYGQDTRTYFPSIRFAMLGAWIHDRLLDGGLILKLMEHLAAITQETVLLSTQNGLEAQHIHVVQTSLSLRYDPPVGTRRSLIRSSVGRVLLCDQPRAAILKVVERINTLGIDEGRKFDPKSVLDELAAVRAAGYAYSANQFTQGAATVAVALPPQLGAPRMALSVGGPSSRVDEKAIPKILEDIRSSVAEFLGPESAARSA